MIRTLNTYAFTSIIPALTTETVSGWIGKRIPEATIRNFGFSSLRALDKHYKTI